MRSEGAFFRIVAESVDCGFHLTLERFQRGWSLDSDIDNARPPWVWEGTDATQVDVKAVEGVCLGVNQLSQNFHIFRWDITEKFQSQVHVFQRHPTDKGPYISSQTRRGLLDVLSNFEWKLHSDKGAQTAHESEGGGLTPKCAYHSFLELMEANRLCEVNGRACLHAVFYISGHCGGRDNHHWNIGERGVAAHLPQNIETRYLGHHNIENDHIRSFGGHHGESRCTGGCFAYMKAAYPHHLCK